jgi:hypothetical protein
MITQCQGGIVDHPCANACTALRQPIDDPIRYFVTRVKTSKASQFAVIKRSTGIRSYTSESQYLSYKVAISRVNRCAGWIYHIQLSRKKLQENLVHMISTELSSLATHNKVKYVCHAEVKYLWCVEVKYLWCVEVK